MARARSHSAIQTATQTGERPLDLAAPRVALAERMQAGKALRASAPRSGQARWSAATDRADPIALLRATDALRLPELIPLRYGRMLQSPFAFLRGAAAIMAADLATTPATGVTVQLSGDAHLLNFGAYGTPERNLIFGLNDFDETLPGPWEWDLKRLAASFVVAGRVNGFGESDCVAAVRAVARAYQKYLAEFARMSYLQVWYARVDVRAILALLPAKTHATRAALRFAQTSEREHLRQLSKLTTWVAGAPRIVDDPPLVTHASDARVGDHLLTLLEGYSASLTADRRALFQRYTLVDFARKVVGVGSVGTRCYIMLFLGLDDGDSLFLQIKEADSSALEPYLARSAYAQHGERVVQGQRLIQAASDIFLGWGRAAGVEYYVRQLADMKRSVTMTAMTPQYFLDYARVCGWALARAQARAGEAARISGYLGRSDAFARALERFACAYADQTERDHAALVAAVRAGRVQVETETS